MAKGAEMQMENAMNHRWMKLFIYALIAAVFGMVIYLVVKAEQDPERYMVNIAIGLGTGEAPANDSENNYSGENATLEKGMETVRNALKTFLGDSANATKYGQLAVPDVSEWRMAIKYDSSHSLGAPIVVYSFPSDSSVTDANSFVKKFVPAYGPFTSTGLFSSSDPAIQKWELDVFSGSPVSVGITYGTNGTAQNSIQIT